MCCQYWNDPYSYYPMLFVLKNAQGGTKNRTPYPIVRINRVRINEVQLYSMYWLIFCKYTQIKVNTPLVQLDTTTIVYDLTYGVALRVNKIVIVSISMYQMLPNQKMLVSENG